MRSFPALLCAALAAAATAQSPLTTGLAGTNQGNVGGAVYFDLQINTTVTFTQIDWHCGGNTVAGNGSLNIWLGPGTFLNNTANIGLWTQIATTATVAVAPGGIASAAITTPFALGPGTYAVGLVGVGCNHGYTNGAGCTSSTNPGGCPNGVFSTAEMTFRGGNASNVPFVAPIFSPRIWDGRLHYTLGGNPITVASADPYGMGCYGRWTSFYEIYPNPIAFDLGTVPAGASGVNTVLMTFAGDRYVVSAGTTPFTAPTSQPVAGLSGSVIFTASSALGGPLPFPILYPQGGGVQTATDLEIATDGYILPTTGNTIDSSPTVAEFLTQAYRWAPLWKNLDLLLGGTMHVEIEASGALQITWNNVRNDNVLATGGTTTNTFQVAFFQNGNVEFRYSGMSQEGGGTLPIITGVTQGNNALDRGTIDLSGSLPFTTDPTDNPPLKLVLDARPVLGTNPNLVLSDYPAGTTVGVRVFSFTQHNPGIPLASVGMPDCFAYVNLDVTKVLLLNPGTTTDALIPGGIPVSPIFNGSVIRAQGLTLTSGFNQLGVLSSNGVRILFGSL